MSSVTYKSIKPPLKAGSYREQQKFLFGYYRTVLDDGFTVLSPYEDFQKQPVDLVANPHFAEVLVSHAKHVRTGGRQMKLF